MRISVLVLAAAVVLFSSNEASAEKPEHFNYPIKLINLETGYLLGDGGNVQFGIGQSGMGVAGRMQLTSDVLLDLLTFLNFQVKVGFLKDDGPLPALSTGFSYYNLVSASYIVDTAVREGFADADLELSSGLEIYYFFVSFSKAINPNFRVHAGYQYRYLSGYVDSDKPVELASEEDTLSVSLSVEQNAVHNCFVSGMDFDVLDRLKIITEFGYDFSYERARGGLAMRLGIMDSFSFQVGFLWPGIEIGDDFELPVLPSFSFFWRF